MRRTRKRSARLAVVGITGLAAATALAACSSGSEQQ
jgi:hypothetical protein